MTPFTILILVCSASLDHSACQPETARAAVQGPQVASEMECGFIGQTTIAATAAEVRPDPKSEYLKIVCTHSANKTAELP
ncbi:MAG TPA: hypothetical protein VGG12_05970 [Methylovirgula sp.]